MESLGNPPPPPAAGNNTEAAFYTWAMNVARKLAPDSPEIQSIIRKELEDVLEGRASMDAWIRETRQRFGLRQDKLLKILYEAAKGLKGREIAEVRREFKRQYEQARAFYGDY